MAAVICMLSLALCDFSSELGHEVISLSNQVVSVPRTFDSPCPQSFRYTFDGQDWFGIVVIAKPDPRGVPSNVQVVITVPYKLHSRYIGKVVLVKDQQTSVSDITNGHPLLYRVLFPDQNFIPKLLKIYYNGRLICKGTRQPSRFQTLITLEHTLITRNLTATDETEKFEKFPKRQECGVVSLPKLTGLAVNGRVSLRKQFPWLAAFYHKSSDGESNFICGSSIISAKLVVTAAHCVHPEGDESVQIKPEDASFHMGKYNIQSLEGNYVVSNVNQFVIHPDWSISDDRSDADIAIAVLTKSISFTDLIKPICLWTASTSYEDLVGEKVIVAGWGKTETGELSARPRWIEMPVVSELDCLRSNRAFHELTSNRTFCAGDINNYSGPCHGDSGSPAIVQKESRWFLRGIVSSSLYDPVIKKCDTKNYAVYTDVTKFTSWIYGYIETVG